MSFVAWLRKTFKDPNSMCITHLPETCDLCERKAWVTIGEVVLCPKHLREYVEKLKINK